MFKRLQPDAAEGAVSIFVNGNPRTVRETDTVAAAVLLSNMVPCRTSAVSGEPRAPYCMMGVCFDCLVTIDGVGNRQACLIRVREGMRIEMQQGKRELGA